MARIMTPTTYQSRRGVAAAVLLAAVAVHYFSSFLGGSEWPSFVTAFAFQSSSGKTSKRHYGRQASDSFDSLAPNALFLRTHQPLSLNLQKQTHQYSPFGRDHRQPIPRTTALESSHIQEPSRSSRTRAAATTYYENALTGIKSSIDTLRWPSDWAITDVLTTSRSTEQRSVGRTTTTTKSKAKTSSRSTTSLATALAALTATTTTSAPWTALTNSATAATLQVVQSIARLCSNICNSNSHFSACTSAIVYAISRYWWTAPAILLCGVVPLHTMLLSSSPSLPVTPAVWKLVNMDFVHGMAHAVEIVAAFLASNICYFVSAIYLLWKSQLTTLSPMATDTSAAEQRRDASLLPLALGGWILAAGCMSTLFHAVQALGDYRLAEALCYLDHGVAGSATFYFWHACGAPSRRTWGWAAAGLVTLAFPITAVCPPLYPAFHATWHLLSAVTALVWANDAAPERLANARRQNGPLVFDSNMTRLSSPRVEATVFPWSKKWPEHFFAPNF